MELESPRDRDGSFEPQLIRKGQRRLEVMDQQIIALYARRMSTRKIAELERKVGQLTMEIDLLKKGVQLARRPNDDSYSIVSGPKVSPPREDAER